MVGVLAAAAIALVIVPATRDEFHWRWTSYKDVTAGYQSYVARWPAGRHAAEARARSDELGWAEARTANTVQGFERYVQLHAGGQHAGEARDTIEALHWQKARAANTVQGFERYVQLHADGKHAGEARANIEALHWQEATTANTIKAYRHYMRAHPEGLHFQEAEMQSAALQTNDAPFVVAMMAGTEDSFRKFIEDFPGHQAQADARQAVIEITAGADIVDLLNEKKIAIHATGDGIEKVSVRVRKLVPYPLTVRIPVGSFFVSANPSKQNMVTTAESSVRLTSDEWGSLSPDAACANRPKGIPRGNDTFSVERSPQQAALARLMPVLEKARVDTRTRQAAVWIVTDDANYSDLGVLQLGFGGSRVINAGETARALKICDEAGIDITRRKIWNDRQTILAGLGDAELKQWLEEKQ